jgi:hypothetical protein
MVYITVDDPIRPKWGKLVSVITLRHWRCRAELGFRLRVPARAAQPATAYLARNG